MKVVLTLLAAGVATACEGLVVVVSTGPTPLHTSAGTVAAVGHVDGGTIIVGTPISGALFAYDTGVYYRVVAPAAGTLFVRVTWQSSHGSLGLRLGDTALNTAATKSPLIGRIPVRAGQTCPIYVSATPAQVNAGSLNLPFTVVASME